jgi:hypothetical protein
MSVATLIVAAYLTFSPGLLAVVEPVLASDTLPACAELLKAATQGPKTGKITHVSAMTGAVLNDRIALSQVKLIPADVVRPALAYTIQGPGHEVGIVVCGTRPADPDPEPETN